MFRVLSYYGGRRTLLRVVCDLLLVSVAFFGISLFLVGRSDPRVLFTTPGLSLLAGLLFINTASGLYGTAHAQSSHSSWLRAAFVIALSLLLSYAVLSLFPPQIAEHEELKWLTMLCVGAVVAHRVHAAGGDPSRKPESRVLILGAGTAAQLVGRAMALANPRIKIVGYVAGPNESQSAVDGHAVLRDAVSLKERAVALDVDEIVVALNERRGGNMPLADLLDCRSVGVRVSDVSTCFEKMLGQIRIDQLHPGWLIFGGGFNRSVFRDVAKRLFDIVSSFMLLVCTAPLMFVTAASIVLESRGPIFYRQERVGQNGKTFWVLKFRSMRVDAEHEGKPQWASPNDTRVTRVGAMIRRFRIDELPQFLNVLRGEMSLVGPRPERPFFVAQLAAEIPFYALRHTVKPGLTGWAQVRYQYGATVGDALEKLQYDLYYVKNHSLLLDVAVLFETVGVVLSGKGAR